MSPADTALIVKALAGAGVLFVIALIGNMLSFSSRFVNALVTAIVFAIAYAAIYYLVDRAMLPPEIATMSQQRWLQMVGMAAVLVFVVDLVANALTFSSRFTNALMAAALFAILFGLALYATGGAAPMPRRA
jgi:hypothetical protein